MKTGVSTYSFSKMAGIKDITDLEIIEEASKMGFDVIEFAGLKKKPEDSIEAHIEKIKEKCSRLNIEIGNYTIAADFLSGSGGDCEKEAQRLKGEVKIASMLGSNGMRHDAARGFKTRPSKGAAVFDAALPVMIKGCRAVTEFAQQMGIKTMVENHGFFCQDSERVEKLVSGVNHENFGVLVDIGNFLCVDESPEKAVGRLMPLAFHVHAKDFHVKSGSEPFPGEGWFNTRGGNYLRGSIIGHGNVPVLQCMRIIKNSGYDETVSIEFEGMEEPLQAISLGLENLKRYIEIIK